MFPLPNFSPRSFPPLYSHDFMFSLSLSLSLSLKNKNKKNQTIKQTKLWQNKIKITKNKTK